CHREDRIVRTESEIPSDPGKVRQAVQGMDVRIQPLDPHGTFDPGTTGVEDPETVHLGLAAKGDSLRQARLTGHASAHPPENGQPYCGSYHAPGFYRQKSDRCLLRVCKAAVRTGRFRVSSNIQNFRCGTIV